MSSAKYHSYNCQVDVYRLAVMPGARHVSLDEGDRTVLYIENTKPGSKREEKP